MKKFLALAAALAALSVIPANPAHAQGRRGLFPGLSLIGMTPPLQAKLKLTDEQKTKIEAMRAELQAERQAGQQEAQNGGDRQAIFQKLGESQKKHDDAAMALLTADQKTQFEGLKKESMQYEGLGPASVGLLGVEGLNDDQKGKLKALSVETKTKRDAIFQAVQNGGDRQAAQQQAQALQTDTQAALAKILTADQVKQLEAATPRFGRRANQ